MTVTLIGERRPYGNKRVEHLLVRRILKHYWWWKDSYYAERGARRSLAAAVPEPDYLGEGRYRDKEWDFGRVKFFVSELEKGASVDPVILDVPRGHELDLVDGHHRLAAHHFAQRPTIPAFYSGPVDLLGYLTGRR